MKKSEVLEGICRILIGIDKEEMEEDGWWETGTGAKFGASKLNELLDFVAEVWPGNDWIDLRDGKPSAGQKVLIAANGIITAATADRAFYGDGRIWWGGCGVDGYEWEFTFENDEVTHWMPMLKYPVTEEVCALLSSPA